MSEIKGITHSSDTFEFTIHEHLGVLNKNKNNGWSLEMNIVSWNGGIPKIDIRQWNPEHTRMSRGITLDREEGRKLTEILKDYYIGRENRQKNSVKRDDYER